MAKEESAQEEAQESSAGEDTSENNEEQQEESKEESESSDSSSQEDTSDYDKELERVEREKEEKRQAFQQRKESRKKDDDEEEEQPAHEDIEKMVNERVQEAVADVQRTVQRSQVETMLRERTGSDSEFKLALHHYENTINPTSSTLDDVENAIVLANRHRYRGVQEEQKRANQSNATKGADLGGQREQTQGEPNLSAEDKARLQRVGMKYNTHSGLYEKEVGKGRKITLNPRTGERGFA